MSGKVGATCSSLELQVAPPAFTDTDEWASMKQFEKLATQAIRIEFPNSTNAIRQVDRLGILFYGEYCTTIELLGYSVAIAGFSLYNWAQFPWDHTSVVIEIFVLAPGYVIGSLTYRKYTVVGLKTYFAQCN